MSQRNAQNACSLTVIMIIIIYIMVETYTKNIYSHIAETSGSIFVDIQRPLY